MRAVPLPPEILACVKAAGKTYTHIMVPDGDVDDLAQTGQSCSLCGDVLDPAGKLARIPTRGGWVAHASCLASLPDGGRSIQA